MLSILIPTYNYDVSSLVEILHIQCTKSQIEFEILVNDDASQEVPVNKHLEQKFNSCEVFVQPENKGLSFSRNFLISQSKFSWILLLDADVLPVSENFIKEYLKYTQSDYHIINGGLQYYEVPPRPEELLRWKYGINREALDIKQRLKDSHKNSFLSSNLLVHRSVFDTVTYDSTITQYGYEDLVFQKQVNELNYKVLQIDNAVYHLKLDTSEGFLNKSKQSLQNLSYLIKLGKLDYRDTKISKLYTFIKLPVIKQLTSFLFDVFENNMQRHLKSPSTSLFIFDLYRIGYLTKIF